MDDVVERDRNVGPRASERWSERCEVAFRLRNDGNCNGENESFSAGGFSTVATAAREGFVATVALFGSSASALEIAGD